MLSLSELLWTFFTTVSAEVIRPAEQHVLGTARAAPVYKVRDESKKTEIIPTVIDKFLPSFILSALWSSDDYASLGKTIKVNKVQDEPKIILSSDTATSYDLCSFNLTYTVTLTDPDAPSRDNPEWAEMCHFIATGVSLSSSTGGSCSMVELSDLKDVIPYKAPGPTENTGKHRYVFLVFALANGTKEPLNLMKPKDRQHWGSGKERHGVRDRAHHNGLIPVAASFIYAQNEKQ